MRVGLAHLPSPRLWANCLSALVVWPRSSQWPSECALLHTTSSDLNEATCSAPDFLKFFQALRSWCLPHNETSKLEEWAHVDCQISWSLHVMLKIDHGEKRDSWAFHGLTSQKEGPRPRICIDPQVEKCCFANLNPRHTRILKDNRYVTILRINALKCRLTDTPKINIEENPSMWLMGAASKLLLVSPSVTIVETIALPVSFNVV